jgi:hypothetical protein
MHNICFYVSDHGWGHAARATAIVRHLTRSASNVKVHVRTDAGFELINQCLRSDRVQVTRRRNDFGVRYHPQRQLDVDQQGTHSELKRWVDSWDTYIQEEKRFCRSQEIDLIISDIPPQPFVVARELGIPSVGISSFEWHWVYESMFGPTPEVASIREAYSLADLALLAAPNVPTDVFNRTREIGLVTRAKSRCRDEVRRMLGVPETDLLVYVGGGASLGPLDLKGAAAAVALRNLRVLVPWNVSWPGALGIPRNDPESQDCIGACDLVVCKAGYSTISEAISADVPMLLFHNFIEGEWMTREVSRLGIGAQITALAFVEGEWASKLEALGRWKVAYENLPGRLRKDGAAQAAEEVLTMIRG